MDDGWLDSLFDELLFDLSLREAEAWTGAISLFPGA